MKNTSPLLVAPLATLALLALWVDVARPGVRADAIAWEPTYEAAVARSAEEARVLVVAVQLVGEVASRRMMDDVYTDDTVAELCERTVCLGTSNAYQVGDEDFLAYFNAPSVEAARATDIAVREKVLVPDEDGYVVAPQHVFLAPDGEVLMSVPYEISAAELEWCLVEAILAVDPQADVERSGRARAPRRLVSGKVAKESEAPPPPTPPDDKELAELLRQVDDLEGADLMDALERIMLSDARKALKEIEKQVRLSNNRGGGGVNRRTLLRRVGERSPEPYWELVAAELDHKQQAVRNEAAVALEQLGSSDAQSDLVKRLGREDDALVRKNLARALGASGYDSARARRELIRVARKDDDALVRVNAVLAIGQLTAHDESREYLAQVMIEGEERERAAALVAVAWARDPYWARLLSLLVAPDEIDKDTARPLDANDVAALAEVFAEPSGRVADALATCRAVLGGAPVTALAPSVRQLGGDEVPRRRLFGAAAGD